MRSRLKLTRERAYAVNLRLEPRVIYLSFSPHAVAWDPVGDRLLYHRTEWHFRVPEGSPAEIGFGDVVDLGEMREVICALPRSRMPLGDVSQGMPLATVSVDAVEEIEPGEGGGPPLFWKRTIDCMAVDPDDGIFAVYSTEDDVRYLQTFTPTGGVVAGEAYGTGSWAVPHALIHGSHVYAIEREAGEFGSPPIPGRICRRGVGTPGSLIFHYDFDDVWRYPHSLAIDRENGRLWVVSVKLFDPESEDQYRVTYLTELSLGLGLINEVQLHFGHAGHDEDNDPYWMWDYTGFPFPHFGGNVIWESDDGGVPVFLAQGVNAGAYDPSPFAIDPINVFRFKPNEFVEDVGEGMPTPLFLTPMGLLGADFADLPVVQGI